MNLLDNLGIKTESVTASEAKISLPVTDKIKQPFGIVHGGINAVLADTAASLAANKWLESQKLNKISVGVNITTEHLRPVSNGRIQAIATPIKRGKILQTWQVNLFNHEKLTSTSIITLANTDRP